MRKQPGNNYNTNLVDKLGQHRLRRAAVPRARHATLRARECAPAPDAADADRLFDEENKDGVLSAGDIENGLKAMLSSDVARTPTM